jgi:hypothetical protein
VRHHLNSSSGHAASGKQHRSRDSKQWHQQRQRQAAARARGAAAHTMHRQRHGGPHLDGDWEGRRRRVSSRNRGKERGAAEKKRKRKKKNLAWFLLFFFFLFFVREVSLALSLLGGRQFTVSVVFDLQIFLGFFQSFESKTDLFLFIYFFLFFCFFQPKTPSAAPRAGTHRLMVFNFTAFDDDGVEYRLYMGRDKVENEELIRWAWPEDHWFHVSNMRSVR